MSHDSTDATLPPAGRLAPTILATILLASGATSCVPPPVAAHGPGAAVTMTTTLDRSAVHAGGDGTVRAEIVLRGRAARPGGPGVVPTDLVVVLDRSGSMSGQKIADAKEAVRELIAQLGGDDRFALVSYSSDARVDLPLRTVDESARRAASSALLSMVASLNTNMSAGLDLGIAEMDRMRRSGRVSRLILVSDGLANEGDPSPEGLQRRARRIASSEGVMTTVGVGLDFDEQLMTTLADAGTGNFYFVEEAARLAGVFAGEFGAARETVATGVAVTLRPAPGVQVVDAAGYPVEWRDGAAIVRPGALFAGQERRLWVTLRAPTDVLGERALASVAVSFVDDGTPRRVAAADLPRITCVADRARAIAALDREAWGRSVANEEYRAMQQAVAVAVKEGRKDDAKAHIEIYLRDNATLNATVGSTAVDESLVEAKKLEAQVDDAFTGADQATKQNRMSKGQWAAGQDGRRAGAKK